MADNKQPDKKHKCDLCPASYDKPTSLGIHKRHAHGILGQSDASVSAREKNKIAIINQQKTQGDKTSVNKAKEQTATVEISTDYDPLAFALTIGSIKEFCRHAAEEHGYPTKQFTSQCAKLFLREANR